MKNCLILLLSFISVQIQGQSLRFDVFQGISVRQNEVDLSNPWAGGMNSMQYQSMDLNGDGVLDLVTFDRTSQQTSTFLQKQSGEFVFAPSYSTQFPPIENWFVLVDYNQDGRKDLFCATEAGMKVYQNKSLLGQFRFELVKDPIYTLGFSGLINLYVPSSDIPVIADVDGDGDVDVLAFEPGGHYIELHENVSIQKTGIAGLEFEKSSSNWGNIVQHGCRDGHIENPDMHSQAISQINRVNHSGNSLSRTSNNDLFFGQAACSSLAYVKNVETKQHVHYSTIDFDLLTGLSLHSGVFYAASPFMLRNEVEDLFVSVNTTDNAGFTQDFQHSSFQIKSGKAKPFLQDQMIDVGEKASPCLYDVDSDGDLDLLIGHAGVRKVDGIHASIYFYENKSGIYVLKTADFLGLGAKETLSDLVLQTKGEGVLIIGQSISGPKAFQLVNQQLNSLVLNLNVGDLPVQSPFGLLVLTKSGRIQTDRNTDWGLLSKETWQLRSGQFADVDGDGTTEFVGIDVEGNFHIGNYEAQTNSMIWRSADFSGFRVGRNARIQLADFNSDGRLDLIVGTGAGGIYLLENKSSSPVWDAMEKQALQVWPNPNSGVVHVLTKQSGELQVYNLMGQLIAKASIQSGKTYDFLATNMAFIRFVDVLGQVTTLKIQQD